MPSLQYSSKGLSSLNKFHRKSLVFYVEGSDDKIFWNYVLQKFKIKKFIIKEAGGKNELIKYANKIISEKAEIYVLFDCDYSDILSTQLTDPKIVYTYGYSIENSLYTPKNIINAITIYARIQNYTTSDFKKWLKCFLKDFYDLLILDIANEKYSKGTEILGDNCCRFLKNNNSIKVDDQKIKHYYDMKKKSFSDEEIEDVKFLLANFNKKVEFIVRGHFLTKAIINYIENRVHKLSRKKFSLSKEALFSQLIAQYPNSISNTIDIKYLKDKFMSIAC